MQPGKTRSPDNDYDEFEPEDELIDDIDFDPDDEFDELDDDREEFFDYDPDDEEEQ